MQPLRKNVAIAVDGGGIKGVIVTRALSILEKALGTSSHDLFRLAAGTSTGSIISAGIAVGLSARELDQLYADLGGAVFKKTLRSALWPLTCYRYEQDTLSALLKLYLGGGNLGDFWSASPATDVVITTFDLVDNHTRFIKPWKEEYRAWPVVKAVLASSTVPTYFPVVEGRFIDGGVGAYANPAYLAAYEMCFCLGWDARESTLISLGTGRGPREFDAGQANKLHAWNWIEPILGAFLQSADDQQVHLVKTFFEGLDFRRFQIDLKQPIEMDEPSQIPALQVYGDAMGQMILNDEFDRSMAIEATQAPAAGGFV
ncbi:MAG TPA: patatin-like phospholipase family protein [Anaerolineales bacterium]